MDDETNFIWGGVVRTYFQGFVQDSYPFKISDFIELQLKISDKQVYPVAQIVYAYQDPQKGNFLTVRKTYRANEVKSLSEDDLNEIPEEKIYMSTKLYDIPIENVRAKCEVQHTSEITNMDEYLSYERQYFYDSWYDADTNSVVKIGQPLDFTIQMQHPRPSFLAEIHPIKVPVPKESQEERLKIPKQRAIAKTPVEDEHEEATPEILRRMKNHDNIPRARKRAKADEPEEEESPEEKVKEKRKRGRPAKPKPPVEPETNPSSSPSTARKEDGGSKKAANLARKILHSTNNVKDSKFDVSSLVDGTLKISSVPQVEGPAFVEVDGEVYKFHDCILLVAKSGEPTCVARIEAFKTIHQNTYFNARFFVSETTDPNSKVYNLFKPRDDREIALSDIWGFDFKADSSRIKGKCTVEHISDISDLKNFTSKKNHYYYEYEVKFGSGIIVRIARDSKTPVPPSPSMTPPKPLPSSLSSPFFMGTAGKPITPRSQLPNLPNFPGTVRTHPDLLQFLLRPGISGRLLVLCLITEASTSISYYTDKFVESLVAEYPQVIFIILDPQTTGSTVFKDVTEFPTFKFYKNVLSVGEVNGLQKEKVKDMIEKNQ